MNATIQTTTVTQTANEVLGTTEKKLYYLIIKNERDEKLTINVGQKTHDSVITLLQEDQSTTQLTNQQLTGPKNKKGGL